MWQSVGNTAITLLVGLVVTAFFNGIINIPKKKKAEEPERVEAEESVEEAEKLEETETASE